MPKNSTPNEWYRLPQAEVFDRLSTDDRGLTSEEAAKRIETYGFNELAYKKPSILMRFLRQFHNPLVYILLAAVVMTGGLTLFAGKDMLVDSMVILGVVILNAILGFFQEGKAENALQALKDMIVPECTVERDGKPCIIPTRELVPGDVVILEGGDKVPADLRLFEVRDASVDESVLTGESVPVDKHIDPLDRDHLPPGDQTCMAFSGTFLARGTARGIVVETARNTEFGKIAALVEHTRPHPTPLQKKISDFTRTLIIAILTVGFINFVIGSLFGYSLVYSFLASVSLVVAAIPEMLPMIVTAILALAATTMAARNALIRRLPAAETLGCTTVICSDKTGTLTRNEMTVTRIHAGGRDYAVSGVGYNPDGGILDAGQKLGTEDLATPLRETLSAGFHCNNASLKVADGQHHVVGDPTEGALVVAASKAGVTEPTERLDEIPFDSERMYMATLHPDGEGARIYVKGSPERVLAMCASQTGPQGVEPIDADACLQKADEMASDALRVIGMATKTLPTGTTEIDHHELTDLCFLGMQGMIDPPRDEAIEAVRRCGGAGIRTVMITGDHLLTAKAIARQLGIVANDNARALTGEQLSQLESGELEETVDEVSVYARVAPEHKLAIAEALQDRGQVVAMTGDGVNDAPALKAADIGVAMGMTGTEVSKEASAMVLTDDNFATIVGAVEEGRHVWNNLEKAILFTLPTNGGQALLVMGAVLLAPFIPLFGARLPLEPVQILWVNLFDSFFLTMPLMMEPKIRNILNSPPRDTEVKIADALFLQRVVFIGFAIAVPAFVVYHHFGSAAIVDGRVVDPLLLTQAQTAAFWAVLLVHLGFVMSARSVFRSAFTFSPFTNTWLLAGMTLCLVAWSLPFAHEGFATIFRAAPFPAEWWLVILPCLFPAFIVLELDKFIRKRWGEGRDTF